MKTCPTCGTTYSRRVSFCFDDGAPLVGVPEPEATPPAPKVAAPPVPLPRRGRSLLARRRGPQPVTKEHTDFGDDSYRPKALEPIPVVSRDTPTPGPPDTDRTPPSAEGREHVPPAPTSGTTPGTPTPVAQPQAQAQPAIPRQPTIVPPEEPPPFRPSEAPTIIREASEKEDDDVGVWGLWLTVLLGVLGVVLVGLVVAGGIFFMSDGGGTPPEPPPVAVVPAPTVPAAGVVAPEPAPPVAPDVREADTAAPVPLVEPDTNQVEPDTTVAPEPQEIISPTPVPTVVGTPAPPTRPLPDIRVEPIPTPSPVAPGPSSPWTEVAPEPQRVAPVASAPLVVTSTPSGAAVYVNGVNLGATPFRMTMPGGSYPIELRLEGHESVTSRVVISDSSGSTLDLSLPSLSRSGPVTVMTSPDWIGAELIVDGSNRGTIPASISSLEEGTHTFVVRKGGNEQTFTRSVSLNATGMTVVTLGN